MGFLAGVALCTSSGLGAVSPRRAMQQMLAEIVAPGLLQNLLLTAALILVCQFLLWRLSIRLHDASIVDIF